MREGKKKSTIKQHCRSVCWLSRTSDFLNLKLNLKKLKKNKRQQQQQMTSMHFFCYSSIHIVLIIKAL
jgi:hypothetical protein